MQLGLVGLGRMGANMARRWVEAGHECVGYSNNPADAAALIGKGFRAAASLDHLLAATQIQPNWVQSTGLEPVHRH